MEVDIENVLPDYMAHMVRHKSNLSRQAFTAADFAFGGEEGVGSESFHDHSRFLRLRS